MKEPNKKEGTKGRQKERKKERINFNFKNGLFGPLNIT